MQAEDLPFPLEIPATALTPIAIGSEVEIPQARLVSMVKVNPSRIIGLRPNLSEARPHRIAVRPWESENTAEVMPAHFATSFFSTPKLSIISGWTEVSRRTRSEAAGGTYQIGKDRGHRHGFRESTYC